MARKAKKSPSFIARVGGALAATVGLVVFKFAEMMDARSERSFRRSFGANYYGNKNRR